MKRRTCIKGVTHVTSVSYMNEASHVYEGHLIHETSVMTCHLYQVTFFFSVFMIACDNCDLFDCDLFG